MKYRYLIETEKRAEATARYITRLGIPTEHNQDHNGWGIVYNDTLDPIIQAKIIGFWAGLDEACFDTD